MSEIMKTKLCKKYKLAHLLDLDKIDKYSGQDLLMHFDEFEPDNCTMMNIVKESYAQSASDENEIDKNNLDEEYHEVCEGELNSCRKYTIDEYPLDLMRMSILTTDNIDYLSKNDLREIAEKYISKTACKKLGENNLCEIIMLGEKIRFREGTYGSRGGDTIQQIREDIESYFD